MPQVHMRSDMADEYDLQRFIRVQRLVYQKALGCLRKGTMDPTYMKFIFPRLARGDGPPSHYSITSLDEARAYLSSPLLGGRYQECVGALLPLFAANMLHAVFGEADARDLHASLTLFSLASPRELLETMFVVWFDGTFEEGTMVEINHIS